MPSKPSLILSLSKDARSYCSLPSHREDRRARGLARLQIAMGLGRVLQRIGLVDLDLDGAGFDDLEEIPRHRQHVGALGGIGVERRPREEERALLREDAEIDRRDGPGSLAEAYHHAKRLQAIERLHEGVLADGVIDD